MFQYNFDILSVDFAVVLVEYLHFEKERLVLVMSSQEIYVATLIDGLYYAHHVVLKKDNRIAINFQKHMSTANLCHLRFGFVSKKV